MDSFYKIKPDPFLTIKNEKPKKLQTFYRTKKQEMEKLQKLPTVQNTIKQFDFDVPH